MQEGKFHYFIIITIMVPFTHDSVNSSEERQRIRQRGSTQSIERAVITRR